MVSRNVVHVCRITPRKDVGPTTSPSDMAKHPPMTVRAQALAYHDVKMPLSKIMAKTGMSLSALHRLFKAARSQPAKVQLSFEKGAVH